MFGIAWSFSKAFCTITASDSSWATVTWNSFVSETPPKEMDAVNFTVLSASAALFTTAMPPSMAIIPSSAETQVMLQPLCPLAGRAKSWSARRPSRSSFNASLSACTIWSSTSGGQICPTSKAWLYIWKLSIHPLVYSPFPQLALPIWKMLLSPNISDNGTSLAATDISLPFT